jgi:hypothetical protein
LTLEFRVATVLALLRNDETPDRFLYRKGSEVPGRAVRGLILSVALSAHVVAGAAAAQAVDASVQTPGVIRLDVAGIFTHADQRFTDTVREPESLWYQRIAIDLLSGIETTLATEIDRFFAATGTPVEGAATLGSLTARYQGTTRAVPFRLAVGLLPRTELTFSLPLERDDVLLQALGVADGTLGRNPDATGNAALLASIDPRWEALGASALLPTATSAIGIALSARVMELAGSAPSLPAGAADAQLLAQLLSLTPGAAPPLSGARPWRWGDLEVGARLLAISSFGTAAFPTGERPLDLRLTAAIAARLPTGQEVEPDEPFTRLPTVGHTGFRAGAEADLFMGRRFWLTAGTSLLTLRDREEPLAGTWLVSSVIWSPANELSLGIAPRYRLTETIAMGGRYEMRRSGTARSEIRGENGSFALVTPAGTVQRAGVEMRFSTLASIERVPGVLRGPYALEAGIGFLRTISGPPGIPASGAVILQGSILQRLWGGGTRPLDQRPIDR